MARSHRCVGHVCRCIVAVWVRPPQIVAETAPETLRQPNVTYVRAVSCV